MLMLGMSPCPVTLQMRVQQSTAPALLAASTKLLAQQRLDTRAGSDVFAHPLGSQVLSNTLLLKRTGFLNRAFLPFLAADNGRDPNLQRQECLNTRFPDRFSLIKMSTEVTFRSYVRLF